MVFRSVLLVTYLLGCFIVALSGNDNQRFWVNFHVFSLAPISKSSSGQSLSPKNSAEFAAYQHGDIASKINSTISQAPRNLTKSLTFQDYLQQDASSENDVQIELLNATGKGRLFMDDPLEASADGTDPDQAKSWWSKIFDVILIVVVELIGPLIS